MSDVREQLVAALKKTGRENVVQLRSTDDSLEAIANDIADAIEKGVSFNIVGSATCAEINVMHNMHDGDIWAVKDNGLIVNDDGSRIDVSAGDLVRFLDGQWSVLMHLDLSGYATNEEMEEFVSSISLALRKEAGERVKGDESNASAIKANADSLSAHVSDHSNPHQVTAEQVGAYTKEQVDAEIKKESDARILYDDKLLESIEALESKTGDFVTGEEVSEAIAAEADARIQEDIALNARFDMIPQTDWNETDEGSMAYLANHPTPISEIDIEALFS